MRFVPSSLIKFNLVLKQFSCLFCNEIYATLSLTFDCILIDNLTVLTIYAKLLQTNLYQLLMKEQETLTDFVAIGGKLERVGGKPALYSFAAQKPLLYS